MGTLPYEDSAPLAQLARRSQLTGYTPAHSIPDVINVSDLEDISKTAGTLPCTGIVVEMVAGMNLHEAYPFSLHYQLRDPWDYSVKQGILTLQSWTCCKTVNEPGQRCHSCDELKRDSHLQGILHHMGEGVKDSAHLAYYSMAGLQKVARKKQSLIVQLKLRWLGDTRTIGRKMTVLNLHKRWMVAIGSGNIQHVDRLVSAALS